MNLSPESVTAIALLVPASANQLWCAGQARRAVRPRTRRRMRIANRLMAATLLTNLLLGTVATIIWAAASIGGSGIQTSPPLLWPLILFVTGILVSILSNAVAGPPGQQTAPPFSGTEERRVLRLRRLLRPVRRAVR